LYRSIVLNVPLGAAEISTVGAEPGLLIMEIHERGGTYVPGDRRAMKS
jgi:hypothetical protein